MNRRTKLPDASGAEALVVIGAGGTTEEVAEKVLRGRRVRPQRLKAQSKQSLYRSAEALRHPKSRAAASFSAISEVVPFPKPFTR